MIYTTYNPTTGQIQATYNTVDNVLPANAIEGAYDSRRHYWDGSQIQSKPADPSGIIKYAFDYTTKTWQIDQQQSAINIKKIRNDLLSFVDRVNPVWYSTLTTQQQQDLQAYRQALLDVPQQSGFPESVEWPAKPAWL